MESYLKDKELHLHITIDGDGAKYLNPHTFIGNLTFNDFAHVEHFHTSSEDPVEEPKSEPDPISRKAFEPYIRAGLVTPELMPAKHLSAGEVALLAHDIATRLKIPKFWSFFRQKWGSSCNSSYHSKVLQDERNIPFLKQLNKI